MVDSIIGNDFSGDIKTEPLRINGIRIKKIDHRWVHGQMRDLTGRMDDLEFTAKIYNELPLIKEYGIRGSRISKLVIKRLGDSWGKPLYSWDRELDDDQNDPQANLLRAALIAAVAL